METFILKKKNIFLLATTFCLFSAVYAQNLKVATYNIRYENSHDYDGGNGWKQRCPIIAQLILFYDFDIFGAQEALASQVKDMLHQLPGYGYFGVGRDDGIEAGEFTPIFYKNDKIILLQSGHFWLSETEQQPGRGWDAALPRICTWGRFRTKKDSISFWFFNLHMDHIGVKARTESAKLILQKINTMCAGEPVILTGDFNMDQTSDGYKILSTSEVLKDTYENAEIRYAMSGTFNDFDPNVNTNSRIDHIFVSKGLMILRYGVLTDSYRTETGNYTKDTLADSKNDISNRIIKLPSDHYPVMVEIKFAGK